MIANALLLLIIGCRHSLAVTGDYKLKFPTFFSGFMINGNPYNGKIFKNYDLQRYMFISPWKKMARKYIINDKTH